MKRKAGGMKKGWSGSPFHTEQHGSGGVAGSVPVSARGPGSFAKKVKNEGASTPKSTRAPNTMPTYREE
jgi:hypothetical protein